MSLLAFLCVANGLFQSQKTAEKAYSLTVAKSQKTDQLEAELKVFASKEHPVRVCYNPSLHLYTETLWKHLEPKKDITPITNYQPAFFIADPITISQPTSYKFDVRSYDLFGQLGSGQYLFRLLWSNEEEFHVQGHPDGGGSTAMKVVGPRVFVEVDRSVGKSISISVIDPATVVLSDKKG